MPDLFESPVQLSQGASRNADVTVEWRIWAPFCQQPVLATWTDQQPELTPMSAAGNGYFVLRRSGVAEGLRYAYRLDEPRLLPDPASRWQPRGVHHPSAVFFPETFAWSDHQWRGIPLSSLVIYELHVGTFTPQATFESVINRLPALVDLGITAIELMPVAQFPGERNWGYDGVHLFAAQNSYGGPRGLQRLVDAAHGAGLAVLLDVVYNHLGPEGNYLDRFGPYFSDSDHTPWGRAINYDGPHSDAVRRFVIDNACAWVRDFHFDGLRLDAVQTIIDRSARHILADIQAAVQRVAAEQNREVHVIAETNQNDVRLIAPTEQGGHGLTGIWSDDFHHSIHALLTGERDGYYVDFGSPGHFAKALERGFVHDGCYSRYRRRQHGNSTEGMDPQRFVVCVQNHDQIGNRGQGERLGSLVPAAAERLAAGLLLVSPFTPLLFMGQEYGERRPFPFFCSFEDDDLHEAVRRGRRHGLQASQFQDRGEPRDPAAAATFQAAQLSWQWPAGSAGAGLRRLYRDLLALRPKLRAPSPEIRQGVARLGSAGVQCLTPAILQYSVHENIRVFANLSDQRCRLDAHDVSDAARILSSEDPQYGGSRTRRCGEDELLPYELNVLQRR